MKNISGYLLVADHNQSNIPLIYGASTSEECSCELFLLNGLRPLTSLVEMQYAKNDLHQEMEITCIDAARIFMNVAETTDEIVDLPTHRRSVFISDHSEDDWSEHNIWGPVQKNNPLSVSLGFDDRSLIQVDRLFIPYDEPVSDRPANRCYSAGVEMARQSGSRVMFATWAFNFIT